MNGQLGSLHNMRIVCDKPRSCGASNFEFSVIKLDITQSPLSEVLSACRVRVGSIRACVAIVHDIVFTAFEWH